jgi:myo-inositol catabolism protein IolC
MDDEAAVNAMAAGLAALVSAWLQARAEASVSRGEIA